MRVVRLVGLVAALVLTAAPITLLAQTDTGSLDGRVFDEQKAGMPGVTVTAKNTATGLTRTVQSGATGTYHFPSLPAGTYDLTAEIQGFSQQVRKAVIVQVASQTSADFTMKVGAVTETVVVTGETPLVQTTKSDVGQVITTAMVDNMPLNGRKFQDLSLLVPGTRSSNYYDPTKTEVGGISYGGLTGRSVVINVDGGDNNDGVVRGLLQQFSNDAIQEYKVTTQRYSAEFGRSVGGVVNVITKSGTNEFRGSAFVFARNENLNAKTYFEEQEGLEKQPFEQQQFGGSIGGPIRRDVAHFFAAYERNRRDDFATVFTNNVLPEQEGPQEKPFRNHLFSAKTDFQLGTGNTMIVRYALEDQKRDHDFIGGNTLRSAGALNTNNIHSVIAKDSWVFGNNMLNEALVLFQRFENNITAEDNTNPAVSTPDFTFGANLNTPQQTIQERWQIKNDFSFRVGGLGGDHDFKVGAEMIRSHYGGFFTPTLYGFFNFSNPIPGGDLNAYLNTIADTFTGSAGNNVSDDNWTYAAAYFQDDYKPTSRLTLNLGLRYEVQSGPYSNDFDTLALRRLGELGYPTERQLDTNNIGPRVGFAFDVMGDGRTVARGGYGIYYDEIFQNITLYERWSDVRTPLFFVSASPSPWTPAEYAANREAIRNSFLDPTFAGQTIRLTAPDLVQPWAHHFNLGASHQLTQNISIDVDYTHSEGRDEIHRWRINTPQNVNTRLSPAGVFAPDLGAFIVEGNRGRSEFDGLYVTGKVRWGARASVISSYAWTKTNNIANDFGTQPADITNGNWDLDWGPAPNDLRHRFTLGAVFQLPWGLQYSTSMQSNTGKPINHLAGLGGLRNSVRATDPATGVMFPRNAFLTDGFYSWDMRVSKVFGFGGGRSIEALFEVFNVTDTVNFNRDDYVQDFTSTNFGTPTAIVPNSQLQAQFGARVRF
jgi:outer membrane receptor protein involved in Fe transport